MNSDEFTCRNNLSHFLLPQLRNCEPNIIFFVPVKQKSLSEMWKCFQNSSKCCQKDVYLKIHDSKLIIRGKVCKKNAKAMIGLFTGEKPIKILCTAFHYN